MINYSFTIITACYNGEKYISKCAESIANANYDHDLIEHIIIDDGSTDNTAKICQELAKKFKHIKFYSKPNGNWGSVINYVITNKLAHNDYVLMCDSDDFMLPDAFKIINSKLNNADLFVGAFYRWNGGNKKAYIAPYYALHKKVMQNNKSFKYYSPIICVQSTVIKKDIFYKIPLLREKTPYQDTFLYNFCIQEANTISYSFKPISVYWYQRPGNSMSDFKQEEGNKRWVSNFEQFSERDWINPFVCYLLGNRKLRKYLKKNNLKFEFKTKKLNLQYIPLFCRPIFRLLYLIQIKKYVK